VVRNAFAIVPRAERAYPIRCLRANRLPPSTLAKIEAGITVPSIEQFIRLANSFRVRLPRLLMEVGVIQKKDMAVALKAVPLAAPTELGPRRRIQAKS